MLHENNGFVCQLMMVPHGCVENTAKGFLPVNRGLRYTYWLLVPCSCACTTAGTALALFSEGGDVSFGSGRPCSSSNRDGGCCVDVSGWRYQSGSLGSWDSVDFTSRGARPFTVPPWEMAAPKPMLQPACGTPAKDLRFGGLPTVARGTQLYTIDWAYSHCRHRQTHTVVSNAAATTPGRGVL